MINPTFSNLTMLLLLTMSSFVAAQEFTADPVGDAFNLRLYGKKIESPSDNPNGNVKIVLQRSNDDDDALLSFDANIYDGTLHAPSIWNLGLKGNDQFGLYYRSGTLLSQVSTAAMTFNNSAFNPYVSFGSTNYLARVTVKNELYGQKGIHSTADGDAIFGESTSPGPAIISSGVHGKSRVGNGVYGESEDNDGVYGYSQQKNGLSGYSDGLSGVFGKSTGSGAGIWGEGSSGVFGRSGSYALHASGTGLDGIGLLSLSVNSYGVYGSTQNEESYAGYFEGDVYSTGNFVPSDQKLKKNEVNLTGGLDLIESLRPATYEYDREIYQDLHLPRGLRYGLIAQEVEKVLPHLIKESKHRAMSEEPGNLITEEATSFKAVNYTELIPILIAAVQEQNQLIINLQKQVSSLQSIK